ncbi:hypothetical protein ACFP6A_03595 [Quadrisphaera sp. GCM10027208]|uniref:hypothetical protein n=1 Tax=Quadrisphaera sp. GCM10027208 TaxID=3273423 RepID=UPI003606BD14
MTQQVDPTLLYQQIFNAFRAAAPEGWTVGHITYLCAGKTAEYQALATMPDGRKVGFGRIPRTLSKAFRALRDSMYRPGRGTWYTATATLYPDGRFSLDVDYDHEPQWDSPTSPGHYVEDAEQYPRDEKHTPDWLRQRLTEATKGN